MKTPQEIVALMLKEDAFSKWMQLSVLNISEGRCELQCTVTPEMLNGFNIAHGGITYSLSDSALAFAANAYGHKCVSIETSIAHLRPVHESDTLSVTCTETHRGNTFGIYAVSIHNQQAELVSKFKGTVNISKEIW